MTALSYTSSVDHSIAVPLARATLEAMERAIRNNTAMPIRSFNARTIEGLTDGPDPFARIVRIDAGSEGPSARTIEEFAALVRTSLTAVIEADVDEAEERLIREAMQSMVAISAHAATTAKGDAFPLRAIIEAPSPWSNAKSYGLRHPPVLASCIPLADMGHSALPCMVTLDAEIWHGEADDVPLAPKHVIIRGMSDGVDEEPDPITLLRLHQRLDELTPALKRLTLR